MSYMKDADGIRLDSIVVRNPSFSARSLATKMRLGQSAAVAIAGDSTADEPYEYAPLAIAYWAKYDYPRQNVDYYKWDGTSAYGALMPLNTGVAARTTIMRDEFDRIAADLIGSSPTIPNGSNLWTVNGNGAGDWSVDGSDAVASTDATRGQALYTVPAGDIEVIATALVPASQTARVYVKRVDDNNNLSAYIAKNSSGGQYRLQLIKIIAGVQTTIAQSDYFFVNPEIAEEDLTITVRVVGTRVTGDINGVHVGGILSAGDVTALSAGTKIGIWGSAVTGVKFRRIEVSAITASTAGTLTIWNGSKSGSILSYQQGIISSLFPAATPLDLLVVNSGTNYSTTTPAAYQAAIDAFITAFRVEQPTTPIAIASQSPRVPPFATNVSEHALRMESLPAYCETKKYGLIRTFDAFTHQTVGYNLVQSDGVHDTGGWTGGAGVKASAVLAHLRAALGITLTDTQVAADAALSLKASTAELLAAQALTYRRDVNLAAQPNVLSTGTWTDQGLTGFGSGGSGTGLYRETWYTALPPGTWAVDFYFQKTNNSGIVVLEYSIDGGSNWVSLNANVDLYAASATNFAFTATSSIVLTSAKRVDIRLSSTNPGTKNASSSAYYFLSGHASLRRTA